jgi:hypothetical protein
MEKRLIKWTEIFITLNKALPSHQQTREKAIEFTKSNLSFKASKGWYEKFMQRHFGSLKNQTKTKNSNQEVEVQPISQSPTIINLQLKSMTKPDDVTSKKSKGSYKNSITEFEKTTQPNDKENYDNSDICCLIAKRSPLETTDLNKEVDSQYFSICKMDPDRNYTKSRSPKSRI